MYKSYKGWYKLVNPEKFKLPIDEHMKSYKDGHVNYKSGLELKSIRYADFNKHVIAWSLEPFPIPYVKPCTGKTHRYYVDLFLEFSSGDKLLVEVKSYSETIPPKKPKKITTKSNNNYSRALITYSTNTAKWNAAKEFAHVNNMKFAIITEKELL